MGQSETKSGKRKLNTALNAVCPYFTMFPLEFPYRILQQYASRGEAVLDPFAGRGTTLYAARLNGLPAYGIDSNPVAVAISQAKLANTSSGRVIRACATILDEYRTPKRVPTGDFWKNAFHEDVLHMLCRLREGLLENCESDARKALRAILLGALHGPLNKCEPSYFSNQCPRTFAPKPAYAVTFWRKRRLLPPDVDIVSIVRRRAQRCFADEVTVASGVALQGDSQRASSFVLPKRVSWIVTSPPYYGMRTYIPDQWLRWWFLGGPDTVDYSNAHQLAHTSQTVFGDGLRQVWSNCASVAKPGCRLVVRFGAINDRKVDPAQLIKESLQDSAWRLLTLRNAGSASAGKRQADTFVSSSDPIEEYDVWATLAV
ncbi:MAG: DNA modification methylase [Phycisphaerales bacterium]|nr:DNA modification methylase [Phycisphaerales bacterium]